MARLGSERAVAVDTVSTPHDRAMDRCESARGVLKRTRELAERVVARAQAEVDAAEEELHAYEKKPGIPLPLVEQRRVEDKRWLEMFPTGDVSP